MYRERPRSVRVVRGVGWVEGESGRWVVGRLRRMSVEDVVLVVYYGQIVEVEKWWWRRWWKKLASGDGAGVRDSDSLSSLMSRCTIISLCRYPTASTISAKILCISAGVKSSLC